MIPTVGAQCAFVSLWFVAVWFLLTLESEGREKVFLACPTPSSHFNECIKVSVLNKDKSGSCCRLSMQILKPTSIFLFFLFFFFPYTIRFTFLAGKRQTLEVLSRFCLLKLHFPVPDVLKITYVI